MRTMPSRRKQSLAPRRALGNSRSGALLHPSLAYRNIVPLGPLNPQLGSVFAVVARTRAKQSLLRLLQPKKERQVL